MDLGKYQLVLSVSVILAAAVVALLFDYLKRNNEQLRQANREMKARRGQELRHLRLRENAAQAAPQTRAARRAGKASIEAKAAKAVEVKMQAQRDAIPQIPQAVAPEPEPAAEMGLPVTASPSSASASPSLVTAPPSPVTATPSPASATPSPKKPAMAATSADGSTQAPAETPRRDWSSLLKSARPEDRPAPSLVEQSLGANVGVNDGTLPAGFHSESILNGLLQRNSKVTGMAVSIGATFAADRMPEVVPAFMQSLLEPVDFGAQRGNDFVLLLSEELGTASQRRLNHIVQRLWEFQIEGMDSHGTSFSWGGVEVHEIPLEEALSSATERMVETKRNRKILPIEMRERRTELRRAV